MQSISYAKWAEVIAMRVSDEWTGNQDFAEDSHLLRNVIEKLLGENPQECKKLIGTGIIEEDYFEPLS